MSISTPNMVRFVLSLSLAALLAGCAAGTGDTAATANRPADASPTVADTADPKAAQNFGTPIEAPLAPEACFLTEAEVTAATETSLAGPPEGTAGPEGDLSCLYYLEPQEIVGFGCHCLGTNGPGDVGDLPTTWLRDLPPGGEMVAGVGDGAYYLPGTRGDELWAEKGQIWIKIGIDYQHLTKEQLADLANTALNRLASDSQP